MVDERHLSKQYFSILKNIWYYENTIESINMEKLKQMTADEIHFLIFSTKSKIAHIEVFNIFIYIFFKKIMDKFVLFVMN